MRGVLRHVLGALLAFAATATAPPTAAEGGEAKPPPALLQADEVIFNDKTNVVEARGNVEISRNERILLSDRVAYDLDANLIRAEGDITLLEPSGEVVFAEEVELSGDLREGAIRSFRMLLTDRSRLAAANAVRVEGNKTVLRQVAFTPCDRCESNPEAPPLWQITAEKVVHDQDAKVIAYRNARLEVAGVPVAYTPYFDHPDPTVERKTGLLTPNFEISEELGTTVRAPFYYSISPQRDLTVTPTVSGKQGLAVSTEYRAFTDSGRYRLAGSATVADRNIAAETENNVFRGHIDAEGRFNVNRVFRWGFRANRATDDTYKRLYDFGDERFLDSEIYTEGFHGDDFVTARALAFQGQSRGDPNAELPFVLPEIRYHGRSDRRVLGGRAFLDAGFLGITRRDGRDSRRLSGTFGWERHLVDGIGGDMDVTLQMQSAAYSTNGVEPGNPAVNPANGQGEDFAGRLFPQTRISYSLPMVRRSFLGREILEPRVQAVLAPSVGNDNDIPNEDSRDFNFEDTNLFKLNRFPGHDRVSPGQRLDYGLTYSIHGDGPSTISSFLGQSLRFNGGDNIPDSAGGNSGLSDFVGRVEVRPRPGIDAIYRFRFDEDTLDARRSELGMGVGPRKLRLDLNYTFLDSEGATDNFADAREEIFGRLSSRFAEHWSTFASHRRDIANGEPLETAFGISYHDECILVDVQARETFFEDREVDPERSILFRVALKHLGVISGQ